MLDATDILADKWAKLPERTIVRCWLDAKILSRPHEQLLKSKDKRLRGEQLPDRKGVVDGIIASMSKMSMPADTELCVESLPRVLVDNLCVERQGLEEADVRKAVETWLGVEDDPEVLLDEIELELLRRERKPSDDEVGEEMPRDQTLTDERRRDQEIEYEGVGKEGTSFPGIADEEARGGRCKNQGIQDGGVRYEDLGGKVAQDRGLRNEGLRKGKGRDGMGPADGVRKRETRSEDDGVKDQGTGREIRGIQEAGDQGTRERGNGDQGGNEVQGNWNEGADNESRDSRAGDGDTIESGTEVNGTRAQYTGGGGERKSETRDVATTEQGALEVETREKETEIGGERYKGVSGEDMRTEKAEDRGMPGWEKEEDQKNDLAICSPTALVADMHRRLEDVRSLLSDDGNNGERQKKKVKKTKKNSRKTKANQQKENSRGMLRLNDASAAETKVERCSRTGFLVGKGQVLRYGIGTLGVIRNDLYALPDFYHREPKACSFQAPIRPYPR